MPPGMGESPGSARMEPGDSGCYCITDAKVNSAAVPTMAATPAMRPTVSAV